MSDFYVGYVPKAPVQLGRFVRATVLSLLLAGCALAVILMRFQNPFPAAVFEFGKFRNFEGVVEEKPYPALLVIRPGSPDPHVYSRYLLVARGKHGASAAVVGMAGKQVQLKGQLIYRDNQTMIELVDGSITATSAPLKAASSPINLGTVILTGEIVDSKCYLGVMNPGSGKVHRDCATRCLSGGIPPVLVAAGPGNRPIVYLLAKAGGGPLPAAWAAAHAATPMTLQGRLLRSGETLILEIDPGARAVTLMPGKTLSAGK